MPDAAEPLQIVAVVRDLMFGSKITATARALRQNVLIVRNPMDAASHTGRMLLMDLSLPGAIDGATAWKAAHSGPVIAFASHVESDLIEAARTAGLDKVLARSAFAMQLESLLKSG